MIRPIVVMDKDALVDEGMTAEERVAHTSLACEQLKAAGYFPMLVNKGARVEVVGFPPMHTVNGLGAEPDLRLMVLRVDADAGVDEETMEELRDCDWTVVVVKPGSVVERV